MRSIVCIAIAVVIVGLLTACNQQAAQNYTSQSTSESAQSKQKTSGMTSGNLGDAATLKSGGNVTVFSYNPNQPPPNQFVQPKVGQFAYIDVQQCAPDNGQQQANPFNFQLQMPDNTRLRPEPGWFKPDLNATQLQPGECARGFVTFDVPQGQAPSAVYYSQGGDAAKWSV